ncbi:YndM family protein [Metabacillus fastidiosus]|uniref:YndM family protein n=1 Tax=Metabacillus fastidiosus TaxID=1458 RepID=UPI003D2D9D1D
MKHIKALLIKFTVISIVLLSILPIFDNASISLTLFISAILTGTSYLIGDLFILPKLGNLFASIADLVFSFALIWFLSILFIGNGSHVIGASILAAIFIALSEGLFHAYMKEKVLKKEPDKINFSSNRLQTEFSNEEDIYDLRKRSRRK